MARYGRIFQYKVQTDAARSKGGLYQNINSIFDSLFFTKLKWPITGAKHKKGWYSKMLYRKDLLNPLNQISESANPNFLSACLIPNPFWQCRDEKLPKLSHCSHTYLHTEKECGRKKQGGESNAKEILKSIKRHLLKNYTSTLTPHLS